jgi:transposase
MTRCEPAVRQIQGVLGASKRYPYLATLEDTGEPGRVQFMFGSECLVSYRREDLGTRNGLAGMLASAGVRQADVARVLGVDARQVRRYVREFEAEGLGAVAAGVPGRPRKVTADVEGFVRAEFREVFARRRRGFRAVLLERVEREFGIRLSLERLRQITAPVRAELEAGEAAAVAGLEAGSQARAR